MAANLPLFTIPAYLNNARVDAEYHLGLVSGTGNGVSNSALIAAALADSDNKYPLVFGGEIWELETTLAIPAKSGLRMEGMGFPRTHLEDDDTLIGPVPRLVWDGTAGGTMLTNASYGSVLDGINIQGDASESTGLTADTLATQARVGIHQLTTTGDLNSGKLSVRNCAFSRVSTAILCGVDITSEPDSSGNYSGSTANHADHLLLENITFDFPYDDSESSASTITVVNGLVTLASGAWPTWAGDPGVCLNVGVRWFDVATRLSDSQLQLTDNAIDYSAGTTYVLSQERTCVRVRNEQSVDHVYGKCRVIGYPREIFWFERGGRLTSRGASLSGGRATLLRLGQQAPGNGHFEITGFDMECGSQGGKLLQMDYQGPSNVYVLLSGSINGTVGTLTAPLVTARGSCHIVLRGISGLGLIEDALELIGTPDAGSGDRWATCVLEGCQLDVDDPADLIKSTSVGPYYLKWRDCFRRVHDFGGAAEAWAQPITDGEEVSGGFSIL